MLADTKITTNFAHTSFISLNVVTKIVRIRGIPVRKWFVGSKYKITLIYGDANLKLVVASMCFSYLLSNFSNISKKNILNVIER